MGERAAVERKTGHPNTVASLQADLAALIAQTLDAGAFGRLTLHDDDPEEPAQ